MAWFHTYSWAKPEAPLCYGGNLCCWRHDYFPLCFNSTAVLSCSFTHRDHFIWVELILNWIQFILGIAKEEGIINPTYFKVKTQDNRADHTDKTSSLLLFSLATQPLSPSFFFVFFFLMIPKGNQQIHQLDLIIPNHFNATNYVIFSQLGSTHL